MDLGDDWIDDGNDYWIDNDNDIDDDHVVA
jgi:hypothetical protein